MATNYSNHRISRSGGNTTTTATNLCCVIIYGRVENCGTLRNRSSDANIVHCTCHSSPYLGCLFGMYQLDLPFPSLSLSQTSMCCTLLANPIFKKKSQIPSPCI
ncbi:hypothetical protein GDO86_005401 [Hymenochirus boettgeri]|uniref:Uncharacterized protein n=1 Tax=Hymenochirus boettgeri TaxID=247094 RepID=A0A8T2J670_9PIPI|nr:hypothetical protein GDO86_005401 [Hymenochirus boettgeri]